MMPAVSPTGGSRSRRRGRRREGEQGLGASVSARQAPVATVGSWDAGGGSRASCSNNGIFLSSSGLSRDYCGQRGAWLRDPRNRSRLDPGSGSDCLKTGCP
ncbi:predicted protein [Chaetomium globosum CBS 148.51]|uniref:Uncharacterized protein n=1 Tax=Chaetomium globosum (strain ATCC 6205 / CBS 148.51 / DSM 1962 / NBRC 6347 / NRRL 1970) TaxID=306901 RepID=Q2HC32_CHAGB|nr:uncharacterized protein CHGG_02222 [Chaetomium globosum CBS 148.51]EAQ90287.1 predicted protein [Chaetomium globosum CBS 148.51]